MADIRKDGWEWFHYDNPEFQVQFRKNNLPAYAELHDMIMHWHDDVEFIYMVKGSCYYYVNEEKLRIDEGQGLFVNARQRHLIEASEVDCTLICLIFHPMILCSSEHVANHYVRPVIKKSDCPYLILKESDTWQNQIMQVMVGMSEYPETEDLYLLAMKDLYDLWNALYYATGVKRAQEEGENHDVRSMKKMTTFVQENYWKKIKLSDLCEAGNVGKTKCNALFDEHYNLTPIEFLRNYRIDKAAKLLEASDMTITEIAYEVGFTDSSYFSKIFGQLIGCSPQQYRSYGKGLSRFYEQRFYES